MNKDIVIILIFSFWFVEVVKTQSPSPPFNNLTTPDGFFSVVGPKVLRADKNYQCTATNFNYPGTLLLNISIQGYQQIDGQFVNIHQSVSVNQGSVLSVNLNTKGFISGSYQLVVTSLINGVEFNGIKDLRYQNKMFSIFVQMDKSIYKPNDLIRFRVFALDSETRPFNIVGNTKIELYDSNDNLINEWQNVLFSKGVYEGNFQLFSAVGNGLWRLEITVPNYSTSKTFMVAQYDLPKFEVELEVPPHSWIKNLKLPVTIKATYTYGKPVKGTATLTCNNFVLSDIIVNGTATVNVDLATDLNVGSYIYDHYLIFTVTFQDSLTKKQGTAEAHTIIHVNEYSITSDNMITSFIPGAYYSYTLNVRRFDGTPAKQSTNLFVQANYDYYYSGKSIRLTLDSMGKATSILSVPLNATVIVLNATCEDDTTTFYIYQDYIPTGSLVLRLLTANPLLNKPISVQADVPENVPFIMFTVVSKGILLVSNKAEVTNQVAKFTFTPNFLFAPTISVTAYYINQNGVFVTDTFEITLREFLPNSLSLKLSKNITEPGTDITLDVTGTMGSTAYFLAVDKSLLLLNSGGNLTKSVIFDDLELYDGFPRYYGIESFSTMSDVSSQIVSRFTVAKVVAVSNAFNDPIYNDYYQEGYNPPDLPPLFSNDIRVRRDFSETFLWESLEILKPDGKASYTVTVPDTLTSWVIYAISISSLYGIALLDQNPMLTVFMPFFIQLNLPYSVKRGETLVLEIIISNYLESDLPVNITIPKNDTEFMTVNSPEWIDLPSGYTNMITIKADDISVLKISVIPKIVGSVTLKVKAVTPVAGDAIEQKLLVESEGIPQSISNASLIIKYLPNSQLSDLQCTLPPNAVTDTISVEALVTGNIIGNALDHLGGLIQMPYGCGEQNLLNFVPNIIIYIYLKNSNLLTPEISEKIVSYTREGYQRQLSYKRIDGSFSAFGNSDNSGSTWLTAYTLKAFVWAQSYNIITVDSAVIDSTLNFILTQQNSDGSFAEPGNVIHKDMQGESGTGVALSAYIAIVLTELLPSRPYLNTNLQKVLNFIANKTDTSDVYTLAIASYVLQINSHPQRSKIIVPFLSKNIENSTTLHWEKPNIDQSSSYDQPRSIDIEITAYGLLFYLRQPALSGKSVKIVKWLTSKFNKFGGFYSSQDTVVGIESLSKFAALSSGESNLNIILTPNAGNTVRTTVNSLNNKLLQKFPLDQNVRSMAMNVTGTGLAVIQLVCNFYTVDAGLSPKFNVEIDFPNSCDQLLNIHICVNYISNNSSEMSNMVLIVVDVPSGYVVDQPNNIQSSELKQVDLKNDAATVEIYMDSLGRLKRCFTLTATQQVLVQNPKESTIEVRDYYDNSKKTTLPYVLPPLPRCQ